MKSKITYSIILLICFVYNGFSQEISWKNGDMSRTINEKDYAKVEFISNSADLVIVENNGETVTGPEAVNSQYIYSCKCNVLDTNVFGFVVSVKGGTDTQQINAWIEEGQYFQYLVDVEDIPMSISEIKTTNQMQVVPVENTGKVTVSCKSNQLNIKSNTGESVIGPTLNSLGIFEYVINYDLTNQDSRTINRELIFSVGNSEEQVYTIGNISPKQGIEVAVVVIQESCFRHQLNYANSYFLNGMYKESYYAYKEAMECSDKPNDVSSYDLKIKNVRKMAGAVIKINEYYDKAVEFHKSGSDIPELMDSCMYYFNTALKYSNVILKENPQDPTSLNFKKKYSDFQNYLPREVSGSVLDNVKMDINGKHFPIKGVYILLKCFENETKKVKGQTVTVKGKEIKEKRITLGETDSQGNFKVKVPRNHNNMSYYLCFVEDGYFDNSNVTEYRPTDADIQKNLIIKITPKNINKSN